MRGYEAAQQIDIFNLDILEPLQKKDKEKLIKNRNEIASKRLFHTLKISNILDNKCNKCEFENELVSCTRCPFYYELIKQGKELSKTTEHKFHRESWSYDRNDKKDSHRERLYLYESITELEQSYLPDEIMLELETLSIADLAREIDCDYSVLRSYINKYRGYKNER